MLEEKWKMSTTELRQRMAELTAEWDSRGEPLPPTERDAGGEPSSSREQVVSESPGVELPPDDREALNGAPLGAPPVAPPGGD